MDAELIGSISEGLTRGEDGIWYADATGPLSYPSDGNRRCFAVEDASFWFRHRNACIQKVVERFPPPLNGGVFDIGGGNGFVAKALADAGHVVVVVEPGVDGALNSSRRGIETVICATTEGARFRNGSLPAVGLFDVIEHIDDDRAFLRSIHPLLQSDGMLYATVPAYSWLWSSDDIRAGHHRRYTRRSFRAALEATGFECIYLTCMFRFLPLPILFFKAIPYRIGLVRSRPTAAAVARDHAVRGGSRAWIVDMLLRPEIVNVQRGRVMRVGGSCLVAARKK